MNAATQVRSADSRPKVRAASGFQLDGPQSVQFAMESINSW
jgi:hypothetical protein